jgi:hypothetical protein
MVHGMAIKVVEVLLKFYRYPRYVVTRRSRVVHTLAPSAVWLTAPSFQVTREYVNFKILSHVTSAKYLPIALRSLLRGADPGSRTCNLPAIATSIMLFARLFESGTSTQARRRLVYSIIQSGHMGFGRPSPISSCAFGDVLSSLPNAARALLVNCFPLLTVTGRLSPLAPWIIMLEQSCMVYSST